jgi:beta-N-acetylhexosaminidase
LPSLMVDIEGTQLDHGDEQLLASPLVGGLILFSRNYHDRQQLSALIRQVRQLRPGLLIAVDQEGGRVQRLRDGFEKLPSLQVIGDLVSKMPKEGDKICFSLGWLMATDVLAAGIDCSFAPVLDLDRDSCPPIGERSFSTDPQLAIELARPYLAGMREAGMASTAKHFPGHGGVRSDSHHELPVDSRNLETVRGKDLQPFSQLVGDYDAIMPGHLLFPAIDSLPVGFSPFWLQQILRDELGFTGVIFSDDLSMAGAADSGSYSERASLALQAGCNVLLVCNNREGVLQALEFLQGWEQTHDPQIDSMRARKIWDRETIQRSPHYTTARHYLGLIAKNQGSVS